jgi:hypothetical protein
MVVMKGHRFQRQEAISSMSSLHLRHSHLLLDTCCLINAHVTGLLADIVRSLPAQVVVVEDIRREVQRFDLQPYLDQGVLLLDDMAEHEAELFLRLLVEGGLGDGEAAVGAVAISRSWAIATDDQPAQSFFQRRAPHIQIVSTPELLRHWAMVCACEPAVLRQTLQLVEVGGRFRLGAQHPLRSWWEASTR